MTEQDWATLPENIDPIDVGAHVVLVSVADPYTRLGESATGIVRAVDDAGTVHVAWDPDGHLFGLIPGVDRWRRLHPRWYDAPMEGVK